MKRIALTAKEGTHKQMQAVGRNLAEKIGESISVEAECWTHHYGGEIETTPVKYSLYVPGQGFLVSKGTWKEILLKYKQLMEE